MHRRPHLATTLALLVAAISSIAGFPGCTNHKQAWNDEPFSLRSPYTTQRDVVWVIAPIRNESGVSVADELRLADSLVSTIQEIRGVSAVPMNRTLAAMRAAGLPEIDNAAQATALARRMNADAVLVGSLTDWDPYEPPRLGLAIALYARSDSMGVIDTTGLDPRRLTMASSDRDPWDFRHDPSEPLSVVALHLDGSNGEVRADLRRFASGRIDPNSATGWKGYLAAMSRFERFACFELTRRLLASEADRLVAQKDAMNKRQAELAAERDAQREQMDTIGAERALMGIDSP